MRFRAPHRKNSSQSGMTLMEILVATAISSLLVSLIVFTMIQIQSSSMFSASLADSINDGSIVLEKVSKAFVAKSGGEHQSVGGGPGGGASCPSNADFCTGECQNGQCNLLIIRQYDGHSDASSGNDYYETIIQATCEDVITSGPRPNFTPACELACQGTVPTVTFTDVHYNGVTNAVISRTTRTHPSINGSLDRNRSLGVSFCAEDNGDSVSIEVYSYYYNGTSLDDGSLVPAQEFRTVLTVDAFGTDSIIPIRTVLR